MKTKLSWNSEKLISEIDNAAKKNMLSGAEDIADEMRKIVPVYSGPPRSSGRKPGTLRDSIEVEQAKDGSAYVFAPSPATFIQYGVKGENRTPFPFMNMALDARYKKYFDSYRNLV